MGMRRLRGRLDAMQAEAQQTMGEAQLTLKALAALAEEVKDGVRLLLIREGDGTLLQFLRGEIEELPLRVKIAIEEEDD